MHFIFALILALLIGFIFWFIGHIVSKELKITEENLLLSQLINIGLGASGSLIIINLIATISKSFIIGLIAFSLVIISLIFWQLKEFKKVCIDLKEILLKGNLIGNIKQNTDKYYLVFIGIINFIYAVTAFSTTKIDRFGQGNTHVFNINQLISDIYPPKYALLPSIDLRSHYGADIFAAILSKFTGCQPEVCLDILTMIFLNLIIAVLYGLTLKFLNSNPINKYLIPFGVFFAWGPITSFFTTVPGESIPQKFLEKIYYLAQNRLTESASWSGLFLNWFFEPSTGIGVFFFLIALYLIFRFFSQGESLQYLILLGVFLSSFVIIDFTKFVILMFGIMIHLLIEYKPTGNINNFKNEEELLKKVGILFLTALVIGFIHGNCLRFDKNYIPFEDFYKFGQTNLNEKFNPYKSNLMLLLVFAFGFFQAYKSKLNWVIFILPYFIASIIIPHLVTIPNAGAGKILMSTNLLGAFSLPLAVAYVEKKLKLKELKLIAFYSILFIILSMSTFVYWVFGDKAKPIFALENGTIKYTGLQIIAADQKGEMKNGDVADFINYLKSKRVKNQSITTDPEYNDIFTANTGLQSLIPPTNVYEAPVKKEAIESLFNDYKKSFLFDNKTWLNKKITWLFVTQKMSRSLMFPQSRKILLNAYLNKGVRLALSNKKVDDPISLKELYEVDPRMLSNTASENFSDLLEQAFNSSEKKDEMPYFIQQIALCPYFGIFNAKSKDFDGDKIADIAFFDSSKKIWHIIYGKDQHEDEIDLTSNILQNYKGTDLFIPIPSDYDGDSKTDIALFNKTNSTWHILDSSNSQVEPPKEWCHEWSEIPLPADIDGDNKTDVSCYNENDGRWPTSLTANNEYYSNNFGLFLSDIPMYSDVDGDNKADYIIYKPQQGLYEVHLTSCLSEKPTGASCGNSPNKSALTEIKIGTTTSRAVPEDYDGDGKVDLATWTPETGKWEIAFARNFLTKGSVVTQKVFTLGKAGDIPMPGDYNGDGKAEIAIYHLNTSKLEIVYENGKNKEIDLSKYKNYIPASFIGI
ncbi:MAG: VCBS repeat-containing protein [Candidatus Melainabacteria bacterium]|nr:VCBS repeat-containing protein [Candidatus Melainabacteria bacterium]